MIARWAFGSNLNLTRETKSDGPIGWRFGNKSKTRVLEMIREEMAMLNSELGERYVRRQDESF